MHNRPLSTRCYGNKTLLQVSRFVQLVTSCDVALTGLNFFSVTRRMLLTVQSFQTTIITLKIARNVQKLLVHFTCPERICDLLSVFSHWVSNNQCYIPTRAVQRRLQIISCKYTSFILNHYSASLFKTGSHEPVHLSQRFCTHQRHVEDIFGHL
jgi:hypothetical protein